MSDPWPQRLEVQTIENDDSVLMEFDGLPFVSHFWRADRPGYLLRVSVHLDETSGGKVSYKISDEPSARKELTLTFNVKKNRNGEIEIFSACTWKHPCRLGGYVYHCGIGKEVIDRSNIEKLDDFMPY